MSSNQLPVELLTLIYSHLRKRDLKNCLLVNKLWNQVARSHFKLHVELHLHESKFEKLLQDLLSCSSFSQNITKIEFCGYTFTKESVMLIKSILNLCKSLHLISFNTFDNSDILKMLYNSNLKLPQIREIKFSHLHKHEFKKYYVWINLKFKRTIRSLTINIDDGIASIPGFENLISYTSKFSSLENLQVTCDSIKKYNLDLNKLLVTNKKLEKLMLDNVNIRKRYALNDTKRKTYPNLSFLSITSNEIDISVFQHIIPKLDNLDYLLLYSLDNVIPDKSLTTEQSEDILNHVLSKLPVKKEKFVRCYFNMTRYVSYS